LLPFNTLGAHVNDVFLLISDCPRIPTSRFQLPIGTFVVGRSTKCDLVVRDDTVSRRHAEIEVTRDTVTIRDLSSRNGTFIDRQRVVTGTAREGQRVTLGKVGFLLTTAAAGQEPRSNVDTASCKTSPSVFGSATLSKAQGRVLSAFLEGLAEKQIGRRLHLSARTVHNHVQAIYRIFNVHSRSELFAHFLARKDARSE
jgi:two-component system, NtrC family, response regulator GlrR